MKTVGTPHTKEAITLVRYRNIENVPHTVEVIKRYCNIYMDKTQSSIKDVQQSRGQREKYVLMRGYGNK